MDNKDVYYGFMGILAILLLWNFYTFETEGLLTYVSFIGSILSFIIGIICIDHFISKSKKGTTFKEWHKQNAWKIDPIFHLILICYFIFLVIMDSYWWILPTIFTIFLFMADLGKISKKINKE